MFRFFYKTFRPAWAFLLVFGLVGGEVGSGRAAGAEDRQAVGRSPEPDQGPGLYTDAGSGGTREAGHAAGAEADVQRRTRDDKHQPAKARTSRRAVFAVGAVVRHKKDGEGHFTQVRMLAVGGKNAEAYFDGSGARLVFQATPRDVSCDRIYVMDTLGGNVEQISSGEGRTTCGYFHPVTNDIYYASTHLGGAACPPRPDFSQGYVWPVYKDYDIFVRRAETGALDRLTDTPGYDAEATISPDGTLVVFTSVRDGDLELYTMRPDGSDQRRITHTPGYDGGAFFSPDGTRLVYRASRPVGKALEEYRALLAEGVIRPKELEIYTCKIDGTDVRQVTDNGAANFCPYYHPDGTRIIFASNMHDPAGRNFDLFLINVDGTGLEQVTFNFSFDAFPMFSPDGSQLVFASDRYTPRSGDINIVIADWQE